MCLAAAPIEYGKSKPQAPSAPMLTLLLSWYHQLIVELELCIHYSRSNAVLQSFIHGTKKGLNSGIRRQQMISPMFPIMIYT